jgi:glycosyltransferase involved in cell wall biosynthesis
MESSPLISIGVPTYNRPEGLRKTLHAITRQSYSNLQIIVSDNASPGGDVREIVEGFSKHDARIQFYRHEINMGATYNFMFVLENATSEYFIWAADDDEWVGDDFLSSLMLYAPSNVLTFPDAILRDTGKDYESPLRVYANCKTRVDYIKAFCSTGSGYPFYGLFNLRLFHEMQNKFQFDDDLIYYGEGTFLHKLFLKCPVKYDGEASICFSTISSKPSYDLLLNTFFEYFKRVILIYSLSDLPNDIKEDVIKIIFDNYVGHTKGLISSKINDQGHIKVSGKERIKRSLKILLKGQL